jgi:hypothetical protein
MRSSLSLSLISSPLRSTVTVWSLPVKRKGVLQSGLTGEPGFAPQVRPPGLNPHGRRDRHLGLGHEGAVDVELGAPGSALPVGDVRRSGGLELEAQLVASLRYGLGEDTR